MIGGSQRKLVALCHLHISLHDLKLSETFSEDERAKYGPIPLGPQAAAEAAAAEKASIEAAKQ